MSDLFGNHIVGFPTRRLIYWLNVNTVVIFLSQAVQEMGEKLISESDINTSDIKDRLEQLGKSWEELKQMAENRYGFICSSEVYEF